MSAIPKLPKTVRAEIQTIEQKRRTLMKEIAKLQDEKRALPNKKTLAKQLGVCYSVLRRTINGDPYRTSHPEDEHVRAA